LAETTIGLFKNECIRADSPFRRGPLRTLADVELITADYVAWYSQQRLCTAWAVFHPPKPKLSTIPNT
jgi:putative transposase